MSVSGRLTPGVLRDDRRVVPLGDRAQEDAGDDVGRHLDRGRQALQVVGDDHRTERRRDLDRLAVGGRGLDLRVLEVGVRGAEVDRVVGPLLDPAAGADGLVVELDAALGVVVLAHLGQEREDERRSGAVELPVALAAAIGDVACGRRVRDPAEARSTPRRRSRAGARRRSEARSSRRCPSRLRRRSPSSGRGPRGASNDRSSRMIPPADRVARTRSRMLGIGRLGLVSKVVPGRQRAFCACVKARLTLRRVQAVADAADRDEVDRGVPGWRSTFERSQRTWTSTVRGIADLVDAPDAIEQLTPGEGSSRMTRRASTAAGTPWDGGGRPARPGAARGPPGRARSRRRSRAWRSRARARSSSRAARSGQLLRDRSSAGGPRRTPGGAHRAVARCPSPG